MRLFGQHVHPPFLLLATAEYGLAALAFILAVSLLLSGRLDLAIGVQAGVLPWIFLFSTTVVLGLTAVGPYQPKQRLRAEGVIVRLMAAIGLAVVVLSLLDVFVPVGPDGPLWILAFALSFTLLGAARVAFSRLVDHDAFRRRVLVYGAGDRA